jgi:hypothetical protein
MAKKKEEKIIIERDKNAGKVLSDGTVLRKRRTPKWVPYFIVICIIMVGFIGGLYAYIKTNIDSTTRKCSYARNCKVTYDKKGNELFECTYCNDDNCTNPEPIKCQAYGGVKNG